MKQTTKHRFYRPNSNRVKGLIRLKTWPSPGGLCQPGAPGAAAAAPYRGAQCQGRGAEARAWAELQISIRRGRGLHGFPEQVAAQVMSFPSRYLSVTGKVIWRTFGQAFRVPSNNVRQRHAHRHESCEPALSCPRRADNHSQLSFRTWGLHEWSCRVFVGCV